MFHNVAQVPLAKDKTLFWSVNRDGTRKMPQASVDQAYEKSSTPHPARYTVSPKRIPSPKTPFPFQARMTARRNWQARISAGNMGVGGLMFP